MSDRDYPLPPSAAVQIKLSYRANAADHGATLRVQLSDNGSKAPTQTAFDAMLVTATP